MPIDEVWVSDGIQANEDIASFGAVNVFRGSEGTTEVDLHVFLPDLKEEVAHVLHPGDTFLVRDQTWKLDHVENPDKPNWEIRLVRVK